MMISLMEGDDDDDDDGHDQGCRNCCILPSWMGEHGVSLENMGNTENMENMERIENINQTTQSQQKTSEGEKERTFVYV